MRKIIILVLGVTFLFFAQGCSKNEDNDTMMPYSLDKSESLTSLTGTKWKLTGFYDVTKGKLAKVEDNNCGECYTFSFYTDSTALGQSRINEIYLKLSSPPTYSPGTFMYFAGDLSASLFDEALCSLESYEVTNYELRLFYNQGKNCLLYKKI